MTRDNEQAAPTAIVAGEVFVGREWALDRVDEWLAGDDQRSLLITGDPGTGKTALALRIAAVSDGRAPADGRSRLCRPLRSIGTKSHGKGRWAGAG